MDTQPIRKLYKELLDSWNEQDAAKYGSCFTDSGCVIGFDGSQMNNRNEIETEIGRIFADHQTADYVSKIQEVKCLSRDTALLRGIAGMIPPGATDINPDANAIQSLIASRNSDTGQWHIVLFQNTPAQFHGRPELAEALTQELQEMVSNK
ncbi:conserved hypothetical protein [Fodinibius roseus]|uniref:SnoaL-like domain-containing protein n=1 Tax=Fodinibius roseus TaxID=1194090 RepID=A0A1M5FIC0_9BACT|nr:SgcJ/EcaC family oxidoreductase [Fodinibius roseus]SHF91228.1 conserved hypothetical protein [Fodinibius roseus]